jgi:hypothetical protein
MLRKINFKALIWNLAPLWTLLVTSVWLWIYLQPIQFNPAVVFQNSMVISGLNQANTSITTSSCYGVSSCWDTMCQLASRPNVTTLELQFQSTTLESCQPHQLQSIVTSTNSSTHLVTVTSTLVMVAIFTELINLMAGAIASGFTFDIFDWIRYGLTAGSMLVMVAAVIVAMVIRIQLTTNRSDQTFTLSLILDGMMIATVIVCSIGSTIARRSVRWRDEYYSLPN